MGAFFLVEIDFIKSGGISVFDEKDIGKIVLTMIFLINLIIESKA